MAGNSTDNARNGGVGLLGLLFIALLVLKIVGYLPNLSWLWVTAPLWGPIALVVLILVAFAALMGVATGIDHYNAYRRRKGK